VTALTALLSVAPDDSHKEAEAIVCATDALSAFAEHARALEPMEPKNSFSDQRVSDELFREVLCATVTGLRCLFRRWCC